MSKSAISKVFSKTEADVLEDIIVNRRDVRGNRFLKDCIDDQCIDKILWAGINAPSVGFSQPWQFVLIKNLATKKAIYNNFKIENDAASSMFNKKDERGELYDSLKLEGIIEAPLNIAVFYTPTDELVLGQTSMPETGPYSVVCAIQNMWLMARALNIGMGWVSILNPGFVSDILGANKKSKLVAYLCLGYTDFFYSQPELEQRHWAKRKKMASLVFNEKF